MFGISSKGDFSNTERFLKKAQKMDPRTILEAFGRKGVAALANVTPESSGLSASSWGYAVTQTKTGWTLAFTNTNLVGGIPVVILIQYGHATGTGGYVQGRDFINPVVRPIFDQIAEEAWKAVRSA